MRVPSMTTSTPLRGGAPVASMTVTFWMTRRFAELAQPDEKNAAIKRRTSAVRFMATKVRHFSYFVLNVKIIRVRDDCQSSTRPVFRDVRERVERRLGGVVRVAI